MLTSHIDTYIYSTGWVVQKSVVDSDVDCGIPIFCGTLTPGLENLGLQTLDLTQAVRKPGL